METGRSLLYINRRKLFNHNIGKVTFRNFLDLLCKFNGHQIIHKLFLVMTYKKGLWGRKSTQYSTYVNVWQNHVK